MSNNYDGLFQQKKVKPSRSFSVKVKLLIEIMTHVRQATYYFKKGKKIKLTIQLYAYYDEILMPK
jgi:hypothetical protein